MLPVETHKKDDDDDPVLLLTLNSETSVPWEELEVKVSIHLHLTSGGNGYYVSHTGAETGRISREASCSAHGDICPSAGASYKPPTR